MTISRSLADDYLAGYEPLAEFYGPRPETLAAADTPPCQPVWDSSLIDETAAFNRRIGSAGADGVDGWHDDPPVAIVTGQQTGIFSGPLYTIYKAVAAIKLARRLARRWNRPVAPVFWVAGDDHDIDEACTIYAPGRGGGVKTYRYIPPTDCTAAAMWNVPLDKPTATRLIDTFDTGSMSGAFRSDIVDMLKRTAQSSQSVAEWFVRLMADIFGSTELVFFDPHGKRAREMAGSVIERELTHPGSAADIANRAGDRLRRLGYQPQVKKDDRDVSCFIDVDGRRTKLATDGQSFWVGDTGRPMTKEAMLDMLRAEPERFSPNVLLRPIVQQMLIPAAAYVAGPGETAYWGQLRDIFAVHGLAMPCVYPRPRAVLATDKQWDTLAALGIELDELGQNPEPLVTKLVRDRSATRAAAAIDETRAAILANIDNMGETLGPEFRRHVARLRSATTHHLDKLAAAAARADEQTVASVRRKIVTLRDAIMPDGRPQERRFSVIPYLSRYGLELIERIVRDLDIEPTGGINRLRL